MAYDLNSIKHGVQEKPPRIILEGLSKIGKSTFASHAPNVIFLPIIREEGIDALDVSSFPVCNTFDEVCEALGSLAESEHTFETICIDSLSALEPLIFDAVCSDGGKDNIEDFGYGKGFTLALDKWRKLQDILDYLRKEKGMSCILIGHVITRVFQDPMAEPYDRYDLDINKKAVAQLQRWCDCILFAGRKTYVRNKEGKGFKADVTLTSGGDTPTLFTQARPAHDGGGRGIYGRLPYELPLTYEAFATAIAAAV